MKLSGYFRHELDVGTLFFLPSAIFFSAPLASGFKACEVAMISEMLLMRFGKKHWPSSGDCGLHGVPVTGLQRDRAVCRAPSCRERGWACPAVRGRDSAVTWY